MRYNPEAFDLNHIPLQISLGLLRFSSEDDHHLESRMRHVMIRANFMQLLLKFGLTIGTV